MTPKPKKHKEEDIRKFLKKKDLPSLAKALTKVMPKKVKQHTNGENLEKRFKNSSGDLLVRKSHEHYGCGIVEILQLWDKNESGCVIGCWRDDRANGTRLAHFESIDKRIVDTKYDSPELLLEVLKFGQKLADIIIEIYEEKAQTTV